MLGLFASPPGDKPTLVNNVETLANVPHILAEGSGWLRASGTAASPGTMLFTVCGDVRRKGSSSSPGNPGATLGRGPGRGAGGGQELKAIFPGASNTVLIPEELDTPMDFESMRQVGSGLGAAGFAVFDDSACMVQATYLYSRFLSVESCGQCPAYKFGTGEVTRLLREIDGPGGSSRDVELILIRARGSTDGQKCALPTGESLLVQSVVQVFADEFGTHRRVVSPPSRAPVSQDRRLGSRARRFTYDLAYARKQPDWTYAS